MTWLRAGLSGRNIAIAVPASQAPTAGDLPPPCQVARSTFSLVKIPSNIVVASLNASTYEKSTTRHFARCRLVAAHFDELCGRALIAFAAALPGEPRVPGFQLRSNWRVGWVRTFGVGWVGENIAFRLAFHFGIPCCVLC